MCGLPPADKTHLSAEMLNNATQAAIDLAPATVAPVVASIYALDGTVRRAASLQLTADANRTELTQQVAKESAA